MSSDTTLRNYLGTAREHSRPRATGVAMSPSLAGARAWFAANLLGLAGVGTALAGSVPQGMLAGWSCFTLLNAALYLAMRSGWLARGAATASGANTAFAALIGFAWGCGVMLLLPATDAIGIAALLAAAFAVALTALPALAGFGAAYVYLVLTLAVLASAATLLDGRYPLAALWTSFGAAGLLVIGKAYADNQARLRAILVELLLGRTAPVGVSTIPDDDALALLARERLSAFDAAMARQERQRQVLRGLGDAVVVTDAEGHVEYVNPVAEVLLGWTRKDLLGRRLEQGMRIVFPPASRNHARDIFEELRRTRRTQHGNESARLLRRDGVVYGLDYTATALKDERGEFAGTVFTLRDVTEKRNRAETIAWQATHDTLTGTINRGEFEVRLKKLLRRAQDDQANGHALLYIDVDKFKEVNDGYGHAAGDALLRELADILRTRIRGADTLARIGGDEFAALLYSCALDRARLVAEAMRIAVDRHRFTWEGIELPLSLSIGIVTIDRDCKGVADLLHHADSACYAAKRYGRNRVHAHGVDASAAGTAKPHARAFDFVRDIRTAIEGNRLELFYRPLLPLGNRTHETARSCELSAGVRTASGAHMPRAQLAELAARYQLSQDIDRWLVQAALDAMRLNQPVLSDMARVMVPLSAQTLADDRLKDFLLEHLGAHRPEAARLGFCVEQAALERDPAAAGRFLGQLRELGCRVLLRDVSLGGASTQLLQALPADYLAIPASLVATMTQSAVDHEIVAGLARSAHALGLKTVAEQVDHDIQRTALAALGIDLTLGEPGEPPRHVAIYSEAQWI
ncbi:MAG: diguanylate cyclase [Gammaproteobacteria bacterium]